MFLTAATLNDTIIVAGIAAVGKLFFLVERNICIVRVGFNLPDNGRPEQQTERGFLHIVYSSIFVFQSPIPLFILFWAVLWLSIE